MRREHLYKTGYIFFLNLAIISLALLILSEFQFIQLHELFSSSLLFSIFILFSGLSILYKSKFNEANNRSNSFISTIFSISPYFFLATLIILAINQFLDLQVITDRNTHLIIVGIFFGFFAFYKNRNKINSQLENQKQKESDLERQRLDNFSHKFPIISRIWGLNTIFRWMYKEGFLFLGLLILIISLTFLMRLFLGAYLPPDLDQGQLIYDAHLINQGLTPFKDFTTRAPLIIYSLALIEKINGGMNLFNAVILISFLFCLSSFFLYFLSKQFFSKNTSLLVVLIFNLVPLIVHYSYTLHVGQGATPFLIAYCLFMVKYIKNKSIKNIFLAGLFLGLGYLVRRDLLMFGVTSFATLFIFNKFRPKHYIIHGLAVAIGISPLIYFILQTNILWINNLYGLGSIFNQIVLKDSSTITSTKWGIIANFFLSSALFIIAFISSFFIKFKNEKAKIASLLVLVIVGLFTYISLNKGLITGGFNILESNYLPIYTVFSLILIALFFLNYQNLTKRINFENKSLFLYGLLIYFYIVFFTFSKEAQPNYFSYTYFIVILFSVATIKELYRLSQSRLVKATIIFSFLLFLLLLNFDYTYYSYERSWTNQDIKNVNSFIQNKVQYDEKLFTVGYTLVVNSNRDIFGNITHHRIYDSNDCPYEEPYKLSICLTELNEALGSGEIKYIIMDQRTYGLLGSREYLAETVGSKFEMIEKISNQISIYKYKSI